MDLRRPPSFVGLDDEWQVHICSDACTDIQKKIGRCDLRVYNLKQLLVENGHSESDFLCYKNADFSGIGALEVVDTQRMLDDLVQSLDNMKVLYLYVMKARQREKHVVSGTQCSVEWPTNLDIDLNMDLQFNSSVEEQQQYNIEEPLKGVIVEDSSGDSDSDIDLVAEIPMEGDTDVNELYPAADVQEEEMHVNIAAKRRQAKSIVAKSLVPCKTMPQS